jgi:hypothetical protein
MLSSDVLALVPVEPQVLDPVVCPVTIDVVDPFGASQLSSQVLLHHESVFHDESTFPG